MLLAEEDIEVRPYATHGQRSEFLYVACGVEVSEAAICRTIKSRLGNRVEKGSVGAASERDEWLRLVWKSLRQGYESTEEDPFKLSSRASVAPDATTLSPERF